jgi:ribosomal protein L40E
MRPEYLARFGSVNMERLGAAPHSPELREMGEGFAEPREIGRRVLNMKQCGECLAWSPRRALTCTRCGREVPTGEANG